MASRGFQRFLLRSKSFLNGHPWKKPALIGCAITGSAAIVGVAYYLKNTETERASLVDDFDKAKMKPSELRFIRFASTEYNGQLFMTPHDFIESVLEMSPRRRHKRLNLSEEHLEDFHSTTPSAGQNSTTFFRDLKTNGILAYCDYLFLLSVLTKPISGFAIAFKMTDLDGNGTIDRKEYKEIEKVFSTPNRSDDPDEKQSPESLALYGADPIDTTLTVHLFGTDGSSVLSFEAFSNFMTNFQVEILELEFAQFAHGLNIISEVDFAKILLRYTYLDTDDYEDYIERLISRFEAAPVQMKMTGITFDEFKSFVLFVNNLNDFILAMRLFTLMNTPITKPEFQKAVLVCTGTEFTQHLVDTLFAIFDINGDGYLSSREFVFIMKDRLHRGYRKMYEQKGWKAFKKCLKKENKFRELSDQDV